MFWQGTSDDYKGVYDTTIRNDPRFLDEESWVWELREVDGRREKCILVNFPVEGPVMTHLEMVQHILDWPVPLTLEKKEKAWGRGKKADTIYRKSSDKSEDHYEAYRVSRAERNCTRRAEQNCTSERRGVGIKVSWSVRA